MIITDMQIDVTGATLSHQWEMSTAVRGGDSGGAVFISNAAAGTIVAAQNGST